jgi:hypothetical protein
MNALSDIRFNTLENTIRGLEKELKQEKSKNIQLVTDFNFNLNLITERDKELDGFSQYVEQLKNEIRNRYRNVKRLTFKEISR